jgi:Leucine-rich repeat (LRR) protein
MDARKLKLPGSLFAVLILLISLLGAPANPAQAIAPSGSAPAPAPASSAPFTSCAAVTQIPTVECEALVAFYNATGGAGWASQGGWFGSDTPCSWAGVYCGDPGVVVGLEFVGYNLTGSLPVELADLTHLQVLDLTLNQITGSIPPQLGSLSQLRKLILSNNQFSGGIPSQLGALSQLQELDLGHNQLTGDIPPELGDLSQLQNLGLGGNLLTGNIPPELGSLSQLRTLGLGGNRLTGSLPLELGTLSQLQGLSLAFNQLTGSLPPELGNLSLLQMLYLQDNRFSGSLPPELGNLTQLNSLYLQNNQLAGSLPPELGNFNSLLVTVNLSANQFTGGIPAALAKLPQLRILDLHDNQLTGSFPPELGNLSQLEELWLNGNQLTGSLPPEIGNLTKLYKLHLEDNALFGEFPVSLTNLQWMFPQELSFDCQLTSTNPAVISYLDGKAPGWRDRCSWLSLAKTGTGFGTVTSSPPGISCGAACASPFAKSSTVTLSASALPGSAFAGWSGAGCSGTAACSVNMTVHNLVQAAFTLNGYTLSINRTGSGAGKVSSSPTWLDCGSTCSVSLPYGTMLTLIASPEAGSLFNGWSGAGCFGAGACALTITGDVSVSADFIPGASQLLTVATSGTGQGLVLSSPPGINCGPACTSAFADGTVVTLHPFPSRSVFTGWSGAPCSGTGMCTVTMDSPKTILAGFNGDYPRLFLPLTWR